MKKTKRFWSVLLALTAILFLFCPLFTPSFAATDTPEGLDDHSSVLIYHNESGKILYKKGEERQIPAGPAPRMTAALLFLEHYGKDLEKTVSVNRRVTGLATSTMNPGLKGGEELSVYDLLCGMLIANSDDAVYALAFDMYEGAENAPDLLLSAMNDKAKTLGMTDTRYVNITGNDPESTEMLAGYSSLADLLKLALVFQEQEVLTKICAIDDITLKETNKSGQRRLLTRNYLLSAKRIGGYTYKYATGLAANEGPLSGYHTIATAKVDNNTFTGISVGAGEKYAAFTDASALFKWADGAYAYKKVLDHTAILGEITVQLSNDSDYVTVAPETDITAFLPKDLDPQKDIRVEPVLEFTDLTAPVHEGLIVGTVTVYYGEEAVGSARLITTGSLSMSNSRYYLTMAGRFFETPIFLSLAAGTLLFCIACVLAGARVQYLRQNRPADLEFIEEDEDEAPVPALSTAGAPQGIKRLTKGLAERMSAKKSRMQKEQEPKKQDERTASLTEEKEPEPIHLPQKEPQEPKKKAAAATKKSGTATQKRDAVRSTQIHADERGLSKKTETAGFDRVAKESQPLAGPSPTPAGSRSANASPEASFAKQEPRTEEKTNAPTRRLTGAKRLPGKDPERQAREEKARQGGYVPSGWGSRKDEKEE